MTNDESKFRCVGGVNDFNPDKGEHWLPKAMEWKLDEIVKESKEEQQKQFRQIYLSESYQPSEEEQNAINAVKEWLNVPDIFVSFKQMKFIADKHNTTIGELRKALNDRRRGRWH